MATPSQKYVSTTRKLTKAAKSMAEKPQVKLRMERRGRPTVMTQKNLRKLARLRLGGLTVQECAMMLGWSDYTVRLAQRTPVFLQALAEARLALLAKPDPVAEALRQRSKEPIRTNARFPSPVNHREGRVVPGVTPEDEVVIPAELRVKEPPR